MTDSHIDTTNTEERQEHQNDTLSATVTTGVSVHSTSYTSTTMHSTSHRDSEVHDQSPLQAPVSETLPTDMSDTTESDAEKRSVAGVCVCVCVCACARARARVCVCTNIDHHGTQNFHSGT